MYYSLTFEKVTPDAGGVRKLEPLTIGIHAGDQAKVTMPSVKVGSQFTFELTNCGQCELLAKSSAGNKRFTLNSGVTVLNNVVDVNGDVRLIFTRAGASSTSTKGTIQITYQGSDASVNTWDDWHLIPSSRPLVNPPPLNKKQVAIPGSDTIVDLAQVLSGRPTYGRRTGSWEFIVENDHWHWETAYSTIMNFLHGYYFNVYFEDFPAYRYTGMLSVNSWKSSKDWSTITIDYDLAAFREERYASGKDWLWDPFSFETGIIRELDHLKVGQLIGDHIALTIPEVAPRGIFTIDVSATKRVKLIIRTYTYDEDTGEREWADRQVVQLTESTTMLSDLVDTTQDIYFRFEVTSSGATMDPVYVTIAYRGGGL